MNSPESEPPASASRDWGRSDGAASNASLSGRDATEGPLAARSVIQRFSDIGSVAQASVPGFYAWAVTVAPVAWSRGVGIGPKVFAVAGVVALVAAMVIERSESAHSSNGRLGKARLLSVWGLVLTSALAWLLSPTAALSSRVDGLRGVGGMLGWGLFAYASAAPTFRRSPLKPLFDGDDLRARSRYPRGDRAYLIGATIAAVGLEFVGFKAHQEERALLVRLVTLAASIAIVTHASEITLARHERGRRASAASRRRAAFGALAAVLLVAALGVGLAALRD